ncbi:hypothetical protein EON65_42935 [archaeon]|nr:MAG: hypothetical protein EON65_42935 [archaeon]
MTGNFYWRGKRTVSLAYSTDIVTYKAKGDIKVLNFEVGTKFDFLAFLNNITGFNNYRILARFVYDEMSLFLELLEVDGFFALNDGNSRTKEAYISSPSLRLEVVPNDNLQAYEKLKMSCLDVCLSATTLGSYRLVYIDINPSDCFDSLTNLFNTVKRFKQQMYFIVDEYDSFANAVMMTINTSEKDIGLKQYRQLIASNESLLRSNWKGSVTRPRPQHSHNFRHYDPLPGPTGTVR